MPIENLFIDFQSPQQVINYLYPSSERIADIVYDEFSFNEDIADDIRNKWKEGVTFFHKVNNEWDIEQEYENFEVSLI